MNSVLTTDFVVSIYITFENKVLLCHHKKLSKWLPVGGHIDENEDPEITLFREVAEECGLPIQVKNSSKPLPTSLLVPNYIDRHVVVPNHEHVSFIYFASTTTPEFILQETELNELRWFTAEELVDPAYDLLEQTIFYAKEALGA